LGEIAEILSNGTTKKNTQATRPAQQILPSKPQGHDGRLRSKGPEKRKRAWGGRSMREAKAEMMMESHSGKPSTSRWGGNFEKKSREERAVLEERQNSVPSITPKKNSGRAGGHGEFYE